MLFSMELGSINGMVISMLVFLYFPLIEVKTVFDSIEILERFPPLLVDQEKVFLIVELEISSSISA